MRAFVRGADGLARALGHTGRIVLVFMVVTICYDVVMRYAFAAPTAWSLEVNTFLVAFLALIPAGDVLRTGDHIRITFFAEKWPAGVRRVADAVTALLGIGFCAVLVWKGWSIAYQAYLYGERMSTPLGTPMAIPYAFIPIGFGVLGLQYLASLVLAVAGDPAAAGREAGAEEPREPTSPI